MFEECLDCNWYDDVLEGDTSLEPFGEYYICDLCAESDYEHQNYANTHNRT